MQLAYTTDTRGEKSYFLFFPLACLARCTILTIAPITPVLQATLKWMKLILLNVLGMKVTKQQLKIPEKSWKSVVGRLLKGVPFRILRRSTLIPLSFLQAHTPLLGCLFQLTTVLPNSSFFKGCWEVRKVCF